MVLCPMFIRQMCGPKHDIKLYNYCHETVQPFFNKDLYDSRCKKKNKKKTHTHRYLTKTVRIPFRSPYKVSFVFFFFIFLNGGVCGKSTFFKLYLLWSEHTIHPSTDGASDRGETTGVFLIDWFSVRN